MLVSIGARKNLQYLHYIFKTYSFSFIAVFLLSSEDLIALMVVALARPNSLYGDMFGCSVVQFNADGFI